MKTAGLLVAQQTAPATMDEAKKHAHDSIDIQQCAEFMQSCETMPVSNSPMDKALRLHGFLDKDGDPIRGSCQQGCSSQGEGDLP